MTNILKIREKIMGAKKAWRPHMANLNNSTNNSRNLKETHEMYIVECKQVEEELRESEEFGNSLLEKSPNPIVVINPDTTIRYINPALEKLTGFSSAEIIGREAPYLWWTEETLKKTSRDLKGAMRKGAERLEELFQKKSGERFWVEITSASVKSNGQLKYYIANWVDITGRKQAEDKLKTILGTALDGFWLTNLEGKILEVNDSYCQTIGYTREELLNMSIPDVEVIESREEIAQHAKKIMTQGYDRFETQHRHKDGKIISVEISANYLNVGQGQLSVFARDITERKQVEQSLANEALRRHILIDESRDGIVILDQNGNVYEANRQFGELLGYSSEEVLQLNVWDWDTQWTQEELLEQIRNVGEDGDQFETYWKRKDGTNVDVEISTNGTTFGGQKLIFCVCRDITARKVAEEALAASENDKKCILNAISDLVLFHQDISLTIKWANEAAARSVGKSPQDLVGKQCFQLWNERNKPCDDCPVIRALETKSSVTGSMKTPDGRSWEILGEPVYDNDGKMIGAIEIAKDITERKRVEEALRIDEERFRLIADNATDMISCIQITPTVRTDYVSPSCLRLTGYKQEEFYTDPNLGLEMIHPDDRKFFQKHLMPDNKNHHKPITIQLVRKDGRIIWIEQTHSIISDEHGEPVAMHLIARDITERKEADEAVKEAENKYRDLLDNTNELIQSVTPDGRFRYVNNGWKQALGYSDEEITNMRVFSIVHPDYLQNYRTIFREIKAGEDVGQIKTAFISKNGSKVVVEGNMTCKFVDGELVYTRSILRDITENKYLEDQMFRLSSAVSMSTDYIVITDFDANIIDVNQKTLEMYGADNKDELLGRHFLELISPEQRGMVNDDVAKVMEKGSLECREYTMISKQDQQYPVQISTSLVRDADGKPMGMVRVGREISNS